MNGALQKEHLDKKAVYRLLTDDGTLATVLHLIALIGHGPEIYEVDPMEVIMRLEEDFNAKVTFENENKLKAILLATSTDIFYDHPEAFRGICETLSNGDPGVEVLDSLSLPEVLWGCYEVELNHGAHEVTPQVQTIIDQVVDGESSDPEMADSPDEDPIQHVWAYMKETHQRLVRQLTELGISPSDIPPVYNPNVEPAQAV